MAHETEVLAVLEELEPIILGKKKEAMKCNCGAVHCKKAVAIAIEPPGDDYPRQKPEWYTWSVKMREDEGGSWSTGLSAFMEVEDIDEIFNKYFGIKKS